VRIFFFTLGSVCSVVAKYLLEDNKREKMQLSPTAYKEKEEEKRQKFKQQIREMHKKFTSGPYSRLI
jgi:hypothetical protein